MRVGSGCNVFICNSPLQILNAYEARLKFALSYESCVLVVCPLSGNEASLKKVAFLEMWNDVVFLDPKPYVSNTSKRLSFFFARVGYVRKWKKYLRPMKGCTRVFFAHTKVQDVRMMASWLGPQELVYIDDGTLTASIISHLEKDGGVLEFDSNIFPIGSYEGDDTGQGEGFYDYAFCLTRRIKAFAKSVFRNALVSFVNGLFGVASDSKSYFYRVFSVYAPYEGGIYLKNERQYLTSLAKEKALDKGVVHFLGAPFVDRRQIDEAVYLEWLSRVKVFFHSKNILYVLHPAESDAFACRVKCEVGIECVRYDMPYEIVFMVSDMVPSIVASWFCSALENISDMGVEGVEVIAFRVELAAEDSVKKASEEFYSRHESSSDIRVVNFSFM